MFGEVLVIPSDIYKINSFKYKNVTLMDSHWKKQFDDAVEFYLNIPNDSLLFGFRKKAGFETPGQELTGWYGIDGDIFGQIVGALSKMYIITQDIRLKEKVYYLINEWAKCIDEEGNGMYPHGNKSSYIYEKLLGGLLDVYEYIGYKKAIECASIITDWAIKNLKRNIKRDGIQDKEITDSQMIEWYTLPENLYRAYELTGDVKYKAFANEWEYDFYWNKFLDKEFKIGPRHAYSHVNTLSSAARAYEVKKEKRYLDIIKNAYDELTTKHIYATGGYGPAETLFGENEGYLGDALKSTWDETLKNPFYTTFFGGKRVRSDTWGNCEVSCCTWAVFKLCNYLLQFTGNAKYGDWVEKMLYNAIGALLPIAPGGKIQYYANYFIDGAVKTVEDRRLQNGGANFAWQCCTGTFPHDVAEYYNLLYYYDDESLYVSQYLPSRVKWEKDSVNIEIQNFSKYPEEDKVKFVITTDKDIEFSFKFRVPSWVKRGVKVKINGEDIELNARANEWGVISRKWQNGDIVSIEFPFHLYFKAVDKQNPDIVALCYGPVVLVCDEMTILKGDVNNPGNWIEKISNEDMIFKTKKGHDLGYSFITRTFRPFYKVGEMKWYYMYNRIVSE
ncbi:beta-L-arabinofuranosidase domain-containing protein [Caldanaerobius polysaccharolyticus]|uniref:beta-L-arabinofuranosidase domain-containing protein n=1 Tax=Caldanaerobius polysaccharolyticus TaxID=44256 RepID=UPI00047EDA9E|nr:beta-L-arabinofuranosidase domain-containing protein [Caldanaerobius polysaccharolyticus]